MPRLHLSLRPMPVGDIYVTSSPTLIAQLTAHTAAHPPRVSAKPPTVVPEYAHATPFALGVSTQRVLSTIGTLTTPPTVALGPFTAASAWAWVRYHWAFMRNGAAIAATPDTDALRFHHATVFSEHAGIGFGLAVVESALRRRYPGAHVKFYDVDFVIAGMVSHLQVTPNVASRRPDYIAEVTAPGGTSYLYLVECKGRRGGSGAASRRQLVRGLEQVTGVRVNGTLVPSFVVGTQVGSGRITVEIVDPEHEPPSYRAADSVSAIEAFDPSLRWRRDEVVDLPLDYLTRRLASVAAAEVLLEAGEAREAEAYLREPVNDWTRFEPVEAAVDGQEVQGRIMRFRLGGVDIVAVRGSTREAVEAARAGRALRSRSTERAIDVPGNVDEDADLPSELGTFCGVAQVQ